MEDNLQSRDKDLDNQKCQQIMWSCATCMQIEWHVVKTLASWHNYQNINAAKVLQGPIHNADTILLFGDVSHHNVNLKRTAVKI